MSTTKIDLSGIEEIADGRYATPQTKAIKIDLVNIKIFRGTVQPPFHDKQK